MSKGKILTWILWSQNRPPLVVKQHVGWEGLFYLNSTIGSFFGTLPSFLCLLLVSSSSCWLDSPILFWICVSTLQWLPWRSRWWFLWFLFNHIYISNKINLLAQKSLGKFLPAIFLLGGRPRIGRSAWDISNWDTYLGSLSSSQRCRLVPWRTSMPIGRLLLTIKDLNFQIKYKVCWEDKVLSVDALGRHLPFFVGRLTYFVLYMGYTHKLKERVYWFKLC